MDVVRGARMADTPGDRRVTLGSLESPLSPRSHPGAQFEFVPIRPLAAGSEAAVHLDLDASRIASLTPPIPKL
jgi:hypothetical protein